jgi:hypothetical protein
LLLSFFRFAKQREEDYDYGDQDNEENYKPDPEYALIHS